MGNRRRLPLCRVQWTVKAGCPCLCFTLFSDSDVIFCDFSTLFSDWVHSAAFSLNSSKIDISNSCGMGLDDVVATVQVLEHPWGATQWLLGPSSSQGHGPFKGTPPPLFKVPC